MNVIKLRVVSPAGWTNRQEDVIDYATAASGLADCFATTTGMLHEIDDSNFWTLRGAENRRGEHSIILAPCKGWPVRHVVAVVVVETVVNRAPFDRFGEVDPGELLGKATPFLGPVPAEVPLADHAGGITLFTEHLRQGEAGIGNQGAFPLADDAPLEATAPIVTAGKYTVTRGRANAGR